MILHDKTYEGKVSYFGGPLDKGVSESEGLALFNPGDEKIYTDLFLPLQPYGTTGLARRLNPGALYCACRWQYDQTPKAVLRHSVMRINKVGSDKHVLARPVDFGPAEWTKRLIDVSPGVMKALDLKTDDEVECCLLINTVC